MQSPIITNIPGQPSIELISYYDKFIKYYPNCEMQTKHWFVQNTKPDWVLLDCGANIGYYSILFSRLAPQGHVYAFEPTITFEMLIQNLAHHHCPNVTPLQTALGMKAGDYRDKIFRIWGEEPENSIYHFSTIDSFVADKKLSRLDCIKIDVDSFDFEVMQGAKDTLLQMNPYIVVELNHALNKRNQSNMEALDWLTSLGYRETINLEYENFVLRREEIITHTIDCHSSITVHFPHSPTTRNPSTISETHTLTNRVLPVHSLHSRLSFATPLDYPNSSLTKPLTQWRMEEDDSLIFRYIYRNFQPTRHLEFGTWEGTGATYCLEESDATVWTLNLLEGEKNESGKMLYSSSLNTMPSVPEWSHKVGGAVQTDSYGFIGHYYREKGFGHRVCQVYCDSRQWDIRNYPPGFFDTILIDGGHQPEIVKSDTQKALYLCRSGGIIMWHDFCPVPEVLKKSEVVRGVYRAIQECWPQLNQDLRDVFWINPSHILLGIKK